MKWTSSKLSPIKRTSSVNVFQRLPQKHNLFVRSAHRASLRLVFETYVFGQRVPTSFTKTQGFRSCCAPVRGVAIGIKMCWYKLGLWTKTLAVCVELDRDTGECFQILVFVWKTLEDVAWRRGFRHQKAAVCCGSRRWIKQIIIILISRNGRLPSFRP